jgi:hypothetical protein
MLAWLKSLDAEVNDKLVINKSTRGGGYGAFVSEAVAKDELLFTVPRQACVTLDDVTDDPNCGEAFANVIKKAGPGGNTVCMAGFLAKEYLMLQQDDDEAILNSSFGPYLMTLPWERGVNNQEHILFWPDGDIESLLKGSLSYQEATELRTEVELATKIMNDIVGPSIRAARGETVEAESGFSWPWESKPKPTDGMVDGLPEAITGAFVCLLTRSFQDGEDDSEKLVPMLDMLQHCDEPNVSHTMRKIDGTVEVRARRDMVAGEELLNQYRSEEEESMPYHRFFTRFGFVPGIQEPIENLLKDRSSIFFAQTAEV